MMRVGGLATGMDVDQIVNQLMDAERIPLNKMQQDRTMLEWQRDGFREINKKLSELDNMMLDMKMSHTYHSKNATSSQEGAVTATATTSASDGAYDLKVTQLASSAINVSQGNIGIDPDKTLGSQADKLGDGFEFKTYHFYTFDENGEKQTHEVSVNENDTLNDVLRRINTDDNHVRAFYDGGTDKIIMETTRTGNYNTTDEFGGNEIGFNEDNAFFTEVLKLTGEEKGGENAQFEYNNSGLTMESRTNSYQLNGINFQFNNVTEGNAKITVSNDTESSFEKIMAFVDKYNEVVETLNESQREERHRDYPPLTDEQKEEMSESEIELWEERAKSGILKGESVITNGLFNMRQSWYSSVDTDGEFTSLTQIGITTSSNYMDGGKLTVDEGELREALQQNPDDVQKLFFNSDDGASRGIVNRLEDALDSTMSQIGNRAGNSNSPSLENYTLGKRMSEINDRISAFEQRLVQVETRYWNQFTEMEKAISRMNQQSAQLMSQFGGGM
ncbi:flagellar hook-associated protein 2 [Virgibacillus kimchii]